MAIFPMIDKDAKAQVSDKIRISGVSSFVSKDEAAVTLVEIEPESGDGFIDVTGTSATDWYLDWAYAGATRTATISLRVTTDGAPVTSTSTISILTSADDKLFTADSDLLRIESDIHDMLPAGRSSFKFMHRKVRDLVLDWFNEMGFRNTDGTKISEDEVLDVDEVKKWSEYWVLGLIFEDASNTVDDKFGLKSKIYESKALEARKRAVIHLDLNKDAVVDNTEYVNVSSLSLRRT